MKRLVLLLIMSFCFHNSFSSTGEVIRVWDQSDHHKFKVTLTAYLPDGGKPVAAVVVCPGGSYFWLDKKNEGTKTAEWLCSHNIAAFVLSYRVAGEFNFITDMRFFHTGSKYPDMLDDLDKAMEIIRGRADEFRINPDMIGVMGFSAGGHLAMLSSILHNPGPSFVAAIYPVVTMSDGRYVHKRSRRGLMGPDSADMNLREALSVEKRVSGKCCPVFVVNCKDDAVVDYHNSVLLDSALNANNVPHKYICYPYGGHGFGVAARKHGGHTYDWTGEFLFWLADTFSLNN